MSLTNPISNITFVLIAIIVFILNACIIITNRHKFKKNYHYIFQLFFITQR